MFDFTESTSGGGDMTDNAVRRFVKMTKFFIVLC